MRNAILASVFVLLVCSADASAQTRKQNVVNAITSEHYITGLALRQIRTIGFAVMGCSKEQIGAVTDYALAVCRWTVEEWAEQAKQANYDRWGRSIKKKSRRTSRSLRRDIGRNMIYLSDSFLNTRNGGHHSIVYHDVARTTKRVIKSIKRDKETIGYPFTDSRFYNLIMNNLRIIRGEAERLVDY